MKGYEHSCKYYETDQMGIIHHSNYIRFMEEARIDFLAQIGYPMEMIEQQGIVSPVVDITCSFKNMSYFADVLSIQVSVSEYKGVKLLLKYQITEKTTGQIRAVGTSSHCFMSKDGRIVALKKRMPELDQLLKDLANEGC